MKPLNLKATLTRTKSGWYFLRFPKAVGLKFQTDPKTRRVVCTLNSAHTFQCALLPNKDEFCIGVNKSIREKLGLEDGSIVKIKLEADTSKYGAPMPEELAEVLNQDPDGDRMFHSLTAGKQRSLIYWVSTVKDVDKRIHLALIMLKHLQDNDGKIDSDKLYKEWKRPMI